MGNQNTKKIWIIIFNVIIMAAILIFVVLYSKFSSQNSFRLQVDHFENTTVTMEQVTKNYLEGEQRICDVWARYINNKAMTMEEAVIQLRQAVYKVATGEMTNDEAVAAFGTFSQ